MSNGPRAPWPPIAPSPAGLAADYLRIDPRTGRAWVDVLGLCLEQIRMSPERASPAAAQVASLVPPTVQPLQGLQPNQRGQSVLFAPGEVNLVKPIFRIAPKGDDSEMMTITLGVEPVDGQVDDSEDAFFQPNLTWGVGGALFNATLDVIRGTQLSICTNRLDVSAVRLPPGTTGDPDAGPPVTWRLSACAGYTATGHASQPARFTDRLGVLEASAGAISRIPNFATSFVVAAESVSGPGTPVNLDIRVRRDLADATQEQNYLYNNNTNIGWNAETAFPIGGLARFVDVVNADDQNDAYVEIIYALAL